MVNSIFDASPPQSQRHFDIIAEFFGPAPVSRSASSVPLPVIRAFERGGEHGGERSDRSDRSPGAPAGPGPRSSTVDFEGLGLGSGLGALGSAIGAVGNISGLGFGGGMIGAGLDAVEAGKRASALGMEDNISGVSAIGHSLSFGLFGQSANTQLNRAIESAFGRGGSLISSASAVSAARQAQKSGAPGGSKPKGGKQGANSGQSGPGKGSKPGRGASEGTPGNKPGGTK